MHSVKLWNSGTYRLENTLSYALERAWCVAVHPHANNVAVGFDEGVVVVKLGCDEPALSMDPAGKLVYTRNTDVLSVNLQAAVDVETPRASASTSPTIFNYLDLWGLAIQVTTDPDHKFDLSLQLDDLEIMRTIPDAEAETKWKAVGDRTLAMWRFDLARECFERAGDLSALMLLLLAIGDRAGLVKLAVQAEEKGQNNLAFASRLRLGDTEACVNLLVKTERVPEGGQEWCMGFCRMKTGLLE
ncbi:coatomer WD associated region-domain-containing protein [Phellopilus nigrolimitatus]|nr:coatomer WD associated region-domain-containing protein [Phellopilus nigrolimitatus]